MSVLKVVMKEASVVPASCEMILEASATEMSEGSCYYLHPIHDFEY